MRTAWGVKRLRRRHLMGWADSEMAPIAWPGQTPRPRTEIRKPARQTPDHHLPSSLAPKHGTDPSGPRVIRV